MLEGYGFRGQVTADDSSDKKGKMGAAHNNLRRKKKKQHCKVGREEEGSSSNRPELAALFLALRDTPIEEPLLYLCVCCFVLLIRYWGIVTVPGSFLFRGFGVAGSSPFTLTKSLATPVPSSSSSNGPTTTTLTTKRLCPGSSVVRAGPKFVRPHW